MPNKKITAMPSLAGNQVPTDLVTAVDLSAAPVNQNVKSTLNDLFAVITKNITDRAIRFQAPGSAPAVAAANQGALYHDGTAFLASSNGGAYEQLYTLSAQSAALVFAGPTSGPAATPTFRSLALTDLPQIATASLLGRISAGTGTPEQITSTAALLTWLQTPISNNLSAAVTDATGPGGALVFANGPALTNPKFDFIGAVTNNFGTNLLFTPSLNAVNYVEILNAVSGTGPTLRAAGSQSNVQLNLASKGTGIISAVGNQFRITGNSAGAAGILELRGGNASLSGGQIRLYEVTTNGTNYIGFQAPDSLASTLLFELPATDGTAGQALTTDGFGILSWASFVSNSIATNSFLGRTAAGTGPVQTLTAGSGVLTWLQTPTSANLAAAVSDETGSGALVFGTSPTFTTSALFPAGSVSAPGITASGDTNTGIWFPSADTLAISTGGLEQLRISSSGYVGIGNNNPGGLLDLSSNTYSIMYVRTTNSTANSSIRVVASNNNEGGFLANDNEISCFSGNSTLGFAAYGANAIRFNTNGVERMAILSGGDVGIGTTTPAKRLHVDGTIRYTNRPAAGTITAMGWDANGDLTSASSSLRYKEDVRTYESGLDIVRQLRPVIFRYHNEDRHNIGFIAEEIEAAGLNEVLLRDDQNRPEGVLYANMVALLVKAIQDLYEIIAEIKS